MSTGSKKVVYAALLGNGSLMILKFIAAYISDSSAMLAEAFHSLADTGNQGLMLLGFSLSMRPPDEKHPFGYGKERYFWTFVVAMGIFTVGATFSIYEGIHRIQHPKPIVEAGLSFGVLALGFLFESVPWYIAFKHFMDLRKGRGFFQTINDSRDPAVMTVLLEDTAALTSTIIAAAGIGISIYTGKTYFDGIASVMIGVLLTVVAFFLSLESRDLLIGESASRRDRARIRQILHSFSDVERVLELLSMHIGPEEILLNLNLEFRDGLTTEEIERLVDDIEGAIRAEIPQVKRIFIEADTPVEKTKKYIHRVRP